MKKFPKVKHMCSFCGGSGEEDVSYHGSPSYEPCHLCKGIKNIEYEREMSVEEKLEHLLSICEKLLSNAEVSGGGAFPPSA